MISIIELIETCSICPSQWEGRDAEGFPYYFRFRHGYLSICRGTKNGDIDSAVCGEEIFNWESDDSSDGFMTFETLSDLVKDIIEFNIKELKERPTFYLVDPSGKNETQQFNNIKEVFDSLKKKD